MKSSRLMLTIATLVATLLALDLSGAHQPANADARVPQLSAPAPGPALMRVAAHTDDDEQLQSRLTALPVVTTSTASASSEPLRAVHRCAEATGAQPAQYCFGAPLATHLD